ncbi:MULTISPECIES: hypothetical protein [unclassified Leptolyngbya]|uniref:hypothetical protein n=1 Tax=unclassified Leptolyngbya TaxID=2650499 RepID=UPI0016874F15|nr:MULTISPECIES: hypothetical protein [unclassified Leptolyngbya]MBD1909216.1 hypothetical protein [Leptolyngbya sp. FACHB-8]MBD2153981.1 hypothetical protein [Leptolyngbya sp. FACHB-16]
MNALEKYAAAVASRRGYQLQLLDKQYVLINVETGRIVGYRTLDGVLSYLEVIEENSTEKD